MKVFIILWFTSAIMMICNGFARTRSDQTRILKSKEGQWGDWSEWRYCNPGHFGNGFKLKVESPGGDDTAGNSFKLLCDDHEYINANKEGEWGDWSLDYTCPSISHIIGFKTKVEDHTDDDTALNSVQLVCNWERTDAGTKILEPSNGGKWGKWDDSYKNCGNRESVCGFRQKVESSQGGSDDTALNAIELACCRNTKEFSNGIGYWELVFGGGGDATLSHKIKYGITKHEQSELTESFGQSLTIAAEKDLTFAKVSLSATISKDITEKTITSYARTMETEDTIACQSGDAAIYQWVTKMTENALNDMFDFEIRSKEFWCVSDDKMVPKCPFGYCKDDDCQECDEYGTVSIEDAITWASEQDLYEWTLFEAKTTTWYDCPEGYVIGGFRRSDCNELHCIEQMKCVAPQYPVVSQSCYEYDMVNSFDHGGAFECNDGYFVNGIQSNGCDQLYCLERLKCCKYNDDKLIVDSVSSTYDWWNCFDGNSWCLVNNNEYITGFTRSSSFATDHPIYLLEEAIVRKISLKN